MTITERAALAQVIPEGQECHACSALTTLCDQWEAAR